MDFTSLSESELLQAHAAVIDELVRRGVVRTRNNPIGDFTEWLVCDRLSLEIQPNSKSSYDGIDSKGTRYQIKGRRIERGSTAAQLSVIRNLEEQSFDFLVAVIYNPDYSIRFGAMIPHFVVQKIAMYRKHVNGHVALIRDSVFEHPGVVNITAILTADSNDT